MTKIILCSVFSAITATLITIYFAKEGGLSAYEWRLVFEVAQTLYEECAIRTGQTEKSQL